ncbi:MAG: beta-lactamase family protein, partial [bacterium]|nr:beta-lactamase family protein [bacterium]
FKLFAPYVTAQITPRDLLNHCSGIPRHDWVWYGDKRSRKEIYGILRYLEPNTGFRSRFQYQNLMYMAGGYLIGQMSGSTWEEVVRERIFEPLGMKASNYSLCESQKDDNFASPYGGQLEKTKRMHFYKDGGAVAPAGGINSNVKDMLQWVRLNLQKGKWQGKQLIKPQTMQQLHTPQVIAMGEITERFYPFRELSYPTYGMGWFIYHYRGRKILFHGGNINGFSALVSFMPDTQTGIVILTNKNGSRLPGIVSFHIYDRLLGITPPPWSKRFKALLQK